MQCTTYQFGGHNQVRVNVVRVIQDSEPFPLSKDLACVVDDGQRQFLRRLSELTDLMASTPEELDQLEIVASPSIVERPLLHHN